MTDEQKQELKSTFRSKYYNAVANCCFKAKCQELSEPLGS